MTRLSSPASWSTAIRSEWHLAGLRMTLGVSPGRPCRSFSAEPYHRPAVVMGTQSCVGESLRRLIQPEVDGASVLAGRRSLRSEPRTTRRVIRGNPAVPRVAQLLFPRAAEFSAENFSAWSTAVRSEWHPAGWRTTLRACRPYRVGRAGGAASLACGCDGSSVVCGGVAEATDPAWRKRRVYLGLDGCGPR